MRAISCTILAGLSLLSFSGCATPQPTRQEQTQPTLRYGLTQEQIERVQRESAPGGALDFTPPASSPPFHLFGGVAYNSRDFSYVQWGRAVKRLGVPTADDAVDLRRLVSSQAMGEAQERALRNGFNASQ